MTLTFEELASSLVRTLGWSRERAEAYARQNLRLPAPDPEDARDTSILEKEEQTEVVKRFLAFNFVVYSASQLRPAKVSSGFPDLWCMHRELPIAFWWETKRQVGGRFSEEQIDFREGCARCGVGYGTGDRYAAVEHLVTLGLAHIVNGVLEPTRRLTAFSGN